MIFVNKKRSVSACLLTICVMSLVFGEARCADNGAGPVIDIFPIVKAVLAFVCFTKVRDVVKSDVGDAGQVLDSSYEEKRKEALQDIKQLFDDIPKQILGDKSLEDVVSEKMLSVSNHEATRQAIANFGWSCGKTVLPIAFATITVFFASKFCWQYASRLVQKPRVVSEYYKQRWFSGKRTAGSAKMVFPKLLKERLGDLIEEVNAVRNAISLGAKNIKFRNIVLYGPAGTGKTMWAKQFVYKSGMDFAFIPAASLLQKGAGIEVVQELFVWAKKSKNGLCLFIDEADALFVDRKKMDQASENYGTINYLLSELGQASDKFMVIATTNYPATFDQAMERRFEVAVEMSLPEFEERVAVLKLYRNTILLSSTNGVQYVKNAKLAMTDAKINSIAQITDRFCYDDFQKIINGIRVSPRAKNGPTEEVIDQIVKDYIAKKAAFAGVK